ncbi:MAG: Rrf2 family transcriptional regulator [Planctomycetaceae bacterium]
MKLGAASVDAVLALVYLAKHRMEGIVQGRIIADVLGIPVESLLKILQQLVRAEIVGSKRGRRGGFYLQRSAGEISLLSILRVTEGRMSGNNKFPPHTVEFAEQALSNLSSTCRNASAESAKVLESTSIRDLMEQDSAAAESSVAIETKTVT